MATDSDLIEYLRAHVEARHQEALAAIETLQAALGGLPRDDVACCRNGSFRACVLKVLTDDWQSIAVIVNASGVDAARVRGVLYAKPLLGVSCESQRVDGRIAFRRIPLTAVGT